MSAVVKYESNVGLAEVMQLGDVFRASGYFKDAPDQAKAVVKILYGRELGFSPVASMMGIHIIEGKPALSSNLMAAMVKRSGRYDYRVTQNDDKECVLTFTEKGEVSGTSSFSMADAKRAGCDTKSTWAKYPRNMMFARALSNGVRMYCPDLSAAPIYVPEELGAEVNEDGDVTAHPIEKPKIVSEPRKFGVVRTVETALEPPAAEVSDELKKFNEEFPPVEVGMRPVATLEQQRAAATGEAIDAGQQTNFAIEFKKALPKAVIGRCEELRHQWLSANGFTDKDGNPTTKTIPKSDFLQIRDEAVNWAKAYKEPK